MKYDIVAFEIPKHKSLLYRMFLDRESLHKAIDDALDKGANVISIRVVNDFAEYVRRIES